MNQPASQHGRDSSVPPSQALGPQSAGNLRDEVNAQLMRSMSQELFRVLSLGIRQNDHALAVKTCDSIARSFVGNCYQEHSWNAFRTIVSYGSFETLKSVTDLAKAYRGIQMAMPDRIMTGQLATLVMGRGNNDISACRLTIALGRTFKFVQRHPEYREAVVSYLEGLKRSGKETAQDIKELNIFVANFNGKSEELNGYVQFALRAQQKGWSLGRSLLGAPDFQRITGELPEKLADYLHHDLNTYQFPDYSPRQIPMAPRAVILAGFVQKMATTDLGKKLTNLYLKQDWSMEPLAQALSRMSNLSKDSPAVREARQKLYSRVIDYYESKGWQPAQVIEGIANMPEGKLQNSSAWLDQAIANNLSLNYLPQGLYGTGIKLAHWKHFDQLYQLSNSSNSRITAEIQECIVISQNTPGLHLPRFDFNRARMLEGPDRQELIRGQIKQITQAAREVLVELAVVKILTSDNPEEVAQNRIRYAQTAGTDILPFPVYIFESEIMMREHRVGLNPRKNPVAIQAQQDTQQVMQRAFDLYFGFNALTFEARRANSDSSSTLQRFGQDCASEVSILNSSDKSSFPGNGFMIRGLEGEKIFAQSLSEMLSEQPRFQQYKQALPWAAREFDQLKNAEFILTRGFLAVSNPGDLRLQIKGTHYSYIVFNNHFYPESGVRAYLIPTDALKKLLKDTAINSQDYSGFDKTRPDLLQAIPDPSTLVQAGGDRTLNLGWASNLSGGLCNAFAPCSSPFHTWERGLENFERSDIYGHFRKEYLVGHMATSEGYFNNFAMEGLRQAHDQVYAISRSYQNLYDLFRLSLSLWHKGQTLSSDSEANILITAPTAMKPAESDSAASQAGNPSAPAQGSESSKPSHPEFSGPVLISNRMLVEAYAWHKSFGLSGTADRDKAPVLAIGQVFNYWNAPDTEVTLDSFDLTLRIGNEKFQLPMNSDGHGSAELKLWNKYVVPKASDLQFDLRFYDSKAIIKGLQ